MSRSDGSAAVALRCQLRLCILWLALALAADPPPAGVTVVWDLAKASGYYCHARTRLPQRRVALAACETSSSAVPGWVGLLQGSRVWPGNANYIQEDCQTAQASDLEGRALGGVTAAWHCADHDPAEWIGRQIVVSAEYEFLRRRFRRWQRRASFAIRRATWMFADADGRQTRPSLLVRLLLKGVLLSYSDSNSAGSSWRVSARAVRRRYLVGRPSAADRRRKNDTSFRQSRARQRAMEDSWPTFSTFASPFAMVLVVHHLRFAVHGEQSPGRSDCRH